MKHKFSWTAFDEKFLKSVLYSEESPKKIKRHPAIPKEYILKEQLVSHMDKLCGGKLPDWLFVKEYKNEIVDNFFDGSARLTELMRALAKKKCAHACPGADNKTMVETLRKMKLTSTVCGQILTELYKQGRLYSEDVELSMFSMPKSIDLTESAVSELPLFSYQEEAASKLKDWYIGKKKNAGILVMPTGSGKTRVATRFILQDMIGRGYQVIWLTHRAALIDQTADAIYGAAPIVRLQDSKKKDFKMICVSGSHSTVKATEIADDVMVFSVQTLIRNLDYLNSCVRDKVLVVIDESHHALAPSYKMIIDKIKAIGKTVKLLGLTATPVRMTDEATGRLMKIFNNSIIYKVDLSDLIAKKYLATPIPVIVNSNIDFDTTISIDEQRYIAKWGELSPELTETIAQNKKRNTLIVDTYLKNRKKYGKTLIFALNQTHCKTLCEMLKDRGIKCDYIYCANKDNAAKIEKFKNGELDVLININIMTEGTDVPEIQTVFLTRPTGSDVLLMQMIGRGMRGTGCGGTETVYIVDFHDKWGTFARWLTPSFDISGDADDTVEAVLQAPSNVGNKKSEIDWEQIRFLMDGIKVSCAGDIQEQAVLPIGWYDVIDSDGNETKILVYESQLAGYAAFWKQRDRFGNKDYSADQALRECFDCFGIEPSSGDLQLLIDTYNLAKKTGSSDAVQPQHLNRFGDRDKIDAAAVAGQLHERNVGIADIDDEIRKVYEDSRQIIDSLYGGFDTYSQRVNDFIRYPKGIKPLGTKIEEYELDILDNYDPNPKYTQEALERLEKEVADTMLGEEYGYLPLIQWTQKRYSGYYGQYSWPKDQPAEGHDLIRINCLLNSESVPENVIKYVIYHELLHKNNHWHDSAFRFEEHKYPDYIECEKFLDVTFPKFDTRYSM